MSLYLKHIRHKQIYQIFVFLGGLSVKGEGCTPPCPLRVFWKNDFWTSYEFETGPSTIQTGPTIIQTGHFKLKFYFDQVKFHLDQFELYFDQVNWSK